MMLLVMEPRAGEIQAQPGEQDFGWGGALSVEVALPLSPCRPTFSLPLPPPPATTRQTDTDAADLNLAHRVHSNVRKHIELLAAPLRSGPGPPVRKALWRRTGLLRALSDPHP